MTAALTTLASGVVSALNAATWVVPFAASATRTPTLALAEASLLNVFVLEVGSERTIETRGGDGIRHTINVILIQQAPAPNAAAVDNLVQLVEEILAYFLRLDITGAVCTRTAADPFYDHQKLETLAQFSSVITLDFVRFT